MSDPLRECPNCGAYILSQDRHCPRCDYLLDPLPASPEPDAAPSPPPAGDADEQLPEGPVHEADLPTTRLPWARPQFDTPERRDEPDAPTQPEPEQDVADVPPETIEPPALLTDELAPAEDADAAKAAGSEPAMSDATRAHPPPSLDALSDELPEPAGAADLPGEPGEPVAVSAAEDEDLEEARAAPEIGEALVWSPPEDGDLEAMRAAEPIDALGSDADSAVEQTVPRLTEDLVEPAGLPLDTSLDDAEMPTVQLRPHDDEPAIPAESTLVRGPQDIAPPPMIPPAPYTAPPPAQVAYAPDPGVAYLQQRVQAYVQGGYQLQVHAPHEAALSQGKQLGVGGWLLALLSIVGFLWYLLIVAISGFRPDMAYLVLEPDGRVYEDGPGAAHVRRGRARAGRRWSIFGAVLFILGVGLALVVGAIAGAVLTQERYQAALRDAYPAVTLFEERFTDSQADPDDVQLAKNGAVVFAILAVFALLGVWGGATLFVIGTVHAGAYRVSVPPLPGYA